MTSSGWLGAPKIGERKRKREGESKGIEFAASEYSINIEVRIETLRTWPYCYRNYRGKIRLENGECSQWRHSE